MENSNWIPFLSSSTFLRASLARLKLLLFTTLLVIIQSIAADFQRLEDHAVWAPGDLWVPAIDESVSEWQGCCTRIDMSIRGVESSIEYAKNLCLGPNSPFTSFSVNPDQTWITMKTAEGVPTYTLGWTTYIETA